ncbi:hypothetical protein H5410_000690 [Solanum commersonii]|uniref:Uncharacterized protein n=1 Tax=Solanum commersonii TaxID=4109 RepID=A0A9J6AWK8_SOLCO|nr:hypothetical protein H5410_000690 [Solanum commersonii]
MGHILSFPPMKSVLESFSVKNVKLFRFIRQDEVLRMIEFFQSSSSETVNARKMIYQFVSSMNCRSTFGKVQDLN